MKTVVSISEARKKLPGIIRSLRSAPDTVYQVTVHDEVVAEIRTSPQVKAGEAAAKLLSMRKKLGGKKKAKKYPLSENTRSLQRTNDYLSATPCPLWSSAPCWTAPPA